MTLVGRSTVARLGLFGWLVFSAPACVTVPSGHLGVLLRSEGVAPEPIGEGAHLIGPLAHAEIYDLRAQEHTEVLAALSADGAMLEARASVLTFRPAAGELVALAREIGPTYYQVIVQPIVRSTWVPAAWACCGARPMAPRRPPTAKGSTTSLRGTT